ncbi:hypothetical protein [Paenibacillus alba]|uniref:Uncharacterized protein n=1 Tax=Paenibacillus alba TaxID=1197127 RepID=A0ABU6G1A5_9BACL|nr:hypothetical protein [Paenibacillus alba]MEC0227350.1 hypothetical protein [Paenibacillus alba]
MLVTAGTLKLWVVDNEHYAYQRIKPNRKGCPIELSPYFLDCGILASVKEYADYLAKSKLHSQMFGPNGMMINFDEGLYIWAMEQNLLIPFSEVVVLP